MENYCQGEDSTLCKTQPRHTSVLVVAISAAVDGHTFGDADDLANSGSSSRSVLVEVSCYVQNRCRNLDFSNQERSQRSSASLISRSGRHAEDAKSRLEQVM
jgi:hypothetical protein